MIISQTSESLDRIAQVVANGGVIAFRTDTFYGLGADPFDRAAVQRRGGHGRHAVRPARDGARPRDREGLYRPESVRPYGSREVMHEGT